MLFVRGLNELTVGIWTELRNDISNTDVDDTQETLILLLEFLLVKDLNCEDAIFIGATNECELIDSLLPGGGAHYKSKLSFQYGFRVLLLTVVVFVCSPLMVATANGSGKPNKH